MVKKEFDKASTIPNIGVKQGSWYFPLMMLFITICAGAVIVLISAIVDILKLSIGLKTIMMMLAAAIIVLYTLAMIKIFKEWYFHALANTDQEIAKAQILFLESFRRAKELKPNAVLYDEAEWIHDLTEHLRRNKPEPQKKRKKKE